MARKMLVKFVLRTILCSIIVLGILLIPALTWLPYWLDKSEFYGPWLTWNDDPRTTIVVNWWTPNGMKCKVLLWNSTYKFEVESEGVYHHVKFSDLKPSSSYKYVISALIGGKWVNVTKIYEFKTAPEDYKPFSVLVIADEQYHYPCFGATERAMAIVRKVSGYDFIISLGDQVEEDTEIPWRRFFRNLGDMAANKTIMPIIGNHEWMEWKSDHAKMFRELFELPGNELWYTFNYSNAVFIALSLFDCKNYTLPDEEVEFLKKTIEKARRAGMWVIVYFHIPAITIYPQDPAEFEFKIVKLLVNLKPDLVLAGHTHAYCRFNVNGTIFVNLASVGGIPDFIAYDTEKMHGYNVEKWSFEYGFGMLEFTDEEIHFVYKTIYGDVEDEFWIRR